MRLRIRDGRDREAVSAPKRMLRARRGVLGGGAARLMVPLLMLGAGASSAAAAPAGVAWSIQSVSQPSNFQASSSVNQYTVTIANAGSQASSGTITVVDHLPTGITTSANAFGQSGWECLAEVAGVVTCTYPGIVKGLEQAPAIFVPVTVSGAADGTTVENHVEVSGGGASECGGAGQPACTSASISTTITSASTPFGVSGLRAEALDGAGALDTQAGAHPNALFTSFDIPTQRAYTVAGSEDTYPVENIRQVVFDLPAGLDGNTQAAPTCTLADLANFGACSHSTQVGVLELIEPHVTQPGVEHDLAIYNITPESGYPAEFGVFDPLLGRAVLMYAEVRTGSDYGLQVTSAPLPRALPISGVRAIFFGDPATYDESGAPPRALFANPTHCGPSFTTEVHIDTWQNPGAVNSVGAPELAGPNWKSAKTESPPAVGCGALQFNPEVEILPQSTPAGAAESPTGLAVDIMVPQNERPEGLASPEIKDVTVTLPPGMAVSPSGANGLSACTDTQEAGRPEGEIALHSAEPVRCPEASKIGSVEVVTPAVKLPLKGSLYVAQQSANPFGSLLAVYLVAEGSGVLVKLAGHVELDPVTGQVTTRFEGNPPLEGEPQQQVSEIKLNVFGGPRAALISPPACGQYEVKSALTPWSGQAPSEVVSDFVVSSGCGGGFAPAFTAGTTNNRAAGFSPLTVALSRRDGEQRLGEVEITTPPGIGAVLKSVAQCPEPAASLGTCGGESQIGETDVAAGPGEDPVWVRGGKVYLTGPYEGAPFGLSIVVPAVAGPFHLGTEIVRARINVDPVTAQVTVSSKPLPRILQGVPLDVRTINVTLDRPGFTFNPSNCAPLSVTGALTSTQGSRAAVSSPFEAANCATLPFKPQLSASTLGHTSKQNGASLSVKIASAGIGQANIAKVDLTIPNILPSRLTTLQKACLEAQFNANPAGCPAASDIATATVHTPLLNAPLTGPVYFVSHGGAAFPDTEMVLQGEGVKLILDGHTDIKKGVTYSRFESIPDAPFTSFEFNAPEGPYSIFGANGNLCQTETRMPTTIVAQNGAILTQSTLVEPEGCANKLTILAHTVKKRTITLKIAVPGAGKLTGTGKGLSKASKSSKGRGIQTLTLKANGHSKLNTKVKLTFAPTKGKKLMASVAASFKR
jgi:uncharacterized repeat protein (TIGR01451 family)